MLRTLVPYLTRASVLLAAITLMASSLVFAQGSDHPNDQPLRVAADVGFAPFAYTLASGETVGFAVDVGAEIANRLGRPGVEIIDVNFSAIFAGLFAKRYEFIIAPTNITEERSLEMLFAEPYMETGLGFLVRNADTMASLEDLAGKVVTVNNGSVSDTWATENAERYGFTVQRYDKNADGVEAVVINRAFANIADLPASQYAATQNPAVKVDYVEYLNRNFGHVFRNDDVEFRNQVECIVEGMKLDGTMAELHQEWFGDMPGVHTAMNTVWVGYGAPGFRGYELTPHQPCMP
ncbi:MAG: transporter substrate-binding domain-containing protein [Trueperaceae bacterium]